MRAVLIVFLHPCLKINLYLLQCSIDVLQKCDSIEFIEHGFLEALADPVGLGMSCLGSSMVDVLHGQVEFILMALGCSTALGSTESPAVRKMGLPDHSREQRPSLGFCDLQFCEPHFASRQVVLAAM